MKDGYDWDVHNLVPWLAQVNNEGTIGDDDEVHTWPACENVVIGDTGWLFSLVSPRKVLSMELFLPNTKKNSEKMKKTKSSKYGIGSVQ